MESATLELPTITEAKNARKQLRRGIPIARVIAFLGGTYTPDTIAAGIERMRIHCREQNKRDTGRGWRGPGVDFAPAKTIPPEVTADRKRRALLEHPPGIAPFGDPPPGYFDGRDNAPSIAASIKHDPLDDVMFRRRTPTSA